MKVTAVRLIHLQGAMDHPEEFWEERLVRPLDLYPQHRDDGTGALTRQEDGRYRMEGIFVRVETDEGGSGGPLPRDQAYVVATQLRPLLLGEDPRATELCWDRVYRAQVHGRKGTAMMALSTLDCALWDLKGKWLGQPVYRILGGPTRE